MVGEMIKVSNTLLVMEENEDLLDVYRKSATDAVSFKIAHNSLSINNHNSFHPEMSHQIFGGTESIYGYKNLQIDLYYLHNSARCLVDISYSAMLEGPRNKPDNIMKALNPWLPESYKTKKEDFSALITDEKHDFMFGEELASFSGSREVFSDEKVNCLYKITLCDTSNQDFINFHQRFETLIIWFIDGANYIDLEDPRWMIFYIYEEAIEPTTQILYRSPIGFCTIYKFYSYPNAVRPRISQFFILPTHQKRGLGTKLYTTVFDHLQTMPDVADITVEEPTDTLQKMRDFADAERMKQYLDDNKIIVSKMNKNQINNILKTQKICKRQSKRIFDILECLEASKISKTEYTKIMEKIKQRIINEHDFKDQLSAKRRCTMNRTEVVSDFDKKAALEVQYNKYISSIERPIQRLKNLL